MAGLEAYRDVAVYTRLAAKAAIAIHNSEPLTGENKRPGAVYLQKAYKYQRIIGRASANKGITVSDGEETDMEISDTGQWLQVCMHICTDSSSEGEESDSEDREKRGQDDRLDASLVQTGRRSGVLKLRQQLACFIPAFSLHIYADFMGRMSKISTGSLFPTLVYQSRLISQSLR